MIEEVPTTTLIKSMMTTPFTVIKCQPDADDDDRETITTEKCVGIIDRYYNVAKVPLENMLAKQAIKVEELCRLLDDMEEVEEDEYDGD